MLSTISLSELLGYTSIACWLGAQFPQVIENYKRQSCEGLALPFLANWLLGELAVSVAFVAHTAQAMYPILSGVYSHTSFHFKRPKSISSFAHHTRPLPSASRTRTSIDRGAARYRTLSAVAANVAASAALAAQQDEHADPRRRWPVHSASRVPADSDDDVDENALAALADSFHSDVGHTGGRRVHTWSIERHRTRSGSLGGMISASHQQLPTSDSVYDAGRGRPLERGEDGVEPELASPGRRQSHRRSAGTMVFLGAWALFGIGTFANRRHVAGTGTVLAARGYEGQARPLYEALMMDPLSEQVIGRIFAWSCTTLYLTSRLPQIWKNVSAFFRSHPSLTDCSLFGNRSSLDHKLTEHAKASSRSSGVLKGEHTHAVILDYLAHQGYTKTAAAFSRDSTVRHLDADGDEIVQSPELPNDELAVILLRKQIYHHIQCGRIDDATSLLNTHFPDVLRSPQRTRPIPPAPQPGTPRRISEAIPYGSPTSTDPAHLLLNLRVQSFIEACRTRPLPFPPPDDTDTELDSANEQEPLSPGREHHNIPPEELAHTHVSIQEQTVLLNKAKKLLAQAQLLPDAAVRATYIRELTNVGGLLAYSEPERSSIRKYLMQERRDALADQIHRAILGALRFLWLRFWSLTRAFEELADICSVSSLELLVRYTSNLWYFANKMDVKPRPGAILPPTSDTSDVSPSIHLSLASLTPLQTVPMFDLDEFLGHKR
ncbi:hypothetical protein DXG01_017134 [Tephrocybe rancida]|nr:hypothetical protein DXG01_017134 [Tephrocybe rancida]